METQQDDSRLKKQRNGLIILGVLLGLSIIGIIIFMTRSGRLADEKEMALSENQLLVIEKENLTEEKQNLEANVEELNNRIRELQETKEEELREKDVRIARLSRVAAEVSALRDEVAAYKLMEEQYEQLQKDFAELQTELNTLKIEHDELAEEYQKLTDSVQLAKPMQVYNINSLTKWNRWLCADRFNVERARRVDETRINFEIDGSLFTHTGERDVHLIMETPAGEIVNPSQETFVITNSEIDSPYTKMRTIDYQNEPVYLRFNIQHEERLDPGTYVVKVYIDGHLTRTSDLRLR